MPTLSLQIVIDPSQPCQQLVAERLRERIDAGESLEIIPWFHWNPGVHRQPGQSGDGVITLMLTPSRCRKRLQPHTDLPSQILILAESVDGNGVELGASTGVTAPSRGDCSSTFMLLQAGGMGSPLACLVQLRIPSLSRWRQQQSRSLLAVADYCLWWLRECEQRERLLHIGPCHPSILLRPAASRRSIRQQLKAKSRWLWQSAQRRLWQCLHKGNAHWQISIFELREDSDRIQPRHHLPPSGDDWFADPFLLKAASNLWLFCERWSSSQGKGVIELFSITASGMHCHGTIIEEGFHLSFPRVFQSRDAWYATVESGDAGEVRLYRAINFPFQWRLERILLSGQTWIDPILIPDTDSGWWLLVNSHHCPSLPVATAAELHLFHSSDLLHAPFVPHIGSPLLIDSTCGRNGGLLTLHGNRIRVGQCTGIDNAYGEAVSLRRIDKLSPQEYRESTYKTDWLSTLHGSLDASHIHTLNNADQWLAIDFRRSTPTPKRAITTSHIQS